MASTHQCCSLLTRLFLALCNLYCTGNTHHCLGQLTRLFLALRALYCTGKGTPIPQSTHEVISCSACFILHWQGHTNTTVYSRGYFLRCVLYTTLARAHQYHSLLTRLFLALRALYYTGKGTPIPQSTHEVISCSACFILHWQGHTNTTVYSRGYFLLCVLYTTLARTHQCCSLFTRLFLALHALYYTGKDTPMSQSTYKVISCSDCFILHWQGHTIATVYSRGYFLLCVLYTTLAGTHHCHSLLTRLFLALQVLWLLWLSLSRWSPVVWGASLLLQVSCHGHPSLWSQKMAIMTPKHPYRCFYICCR